MRLLTVQKNFFSDLSWRVTEDGKMIKLRSAPDAKWNPDFTYGCQTWFFAECHDAAAFLGLLNEKES